MPDFCYYEALEIEKTATQQEVVTAYRNLARVHHPDKNPGDENATARFQRIQAAHETLSDPTKRREYDRPAANPRGSGSSPFSRNANHQHYQHYHYEDSDGYGEFESDDEADYNFFFRGPFGGFDGFRFPGGGYPFPPPPPPPTREEWEQAQRELRRAAEAHAKQQAAERSARDEKEEQCRKKKEEEKKLREKLAEEALKKKESDEKVAQEKRWAELKPKNHAEKQRTCHHSFFWGKVHFKARTKCGACPKGKGMIMFKCPHCALVACQSCLTKNQQERSRLGFD